MTVPKLTAGSLEAAKPPLHPSPDMLAARLEVRAIRPGDEPFLRALYADLRAPELAMTGWPAEMMQAFLNQQFSLQRQHFKSRHPQADFLILSLSDGAGPASPIGRVYLDRTGDPWRLMEIGLFTALRSSGYGSLLLAWINDMARRAGATSVDLQVAIDNPRARAFYERGGFRVEGESSGSHLFMTRRVS